MRWLVLLLFVTTATAQLPAGLYNPSEAAEVTMYIHPVGRQDMAINTQLPDDRYAQSAGMGLTTQTQTCVEEPLPGLLRGDYHTWYSFSSPGYVEYDVPDGVGPRIHEERGLSYDVNLDSRDIDFVWYLESQVTAGEPDPPTPTPNQAPSVIPNVVVKATIRQGDEISVNKVAYNTGAIIAQAQSDPFVMAGPATEPTDQVQVEQLGNRWVYRINFQMPIDKTVIDKDESFNLRVDVFIENPACNEPGAGSYMQDGVRLHTSPGHRPQFTWWVTNAVRIDSVHPQMVGEEWVFHTLANSPFGNYDVRGDLPSDTGSMELDISGPSYALNFEKVPILDAINDHHRHTESVMVIWTWDFLADHAVDGEYTVTYNITNDQESAHATGVATFDLRGNACAQESADGEVECLVRTEETEEPAKKSPGVGVLALLAVVGIVSRFGNKR